MEFIFLFLILPFFIYWCINEKTGLQFSIVVLLSVWTIFLYEYLGENIPFNIDFRWFIIAIIFCGYLFLRDKIEALLFTGGFRAKMIASAILSFVMLLYLPGKELLIPGGIMLGLCTGYCINKRYTGYKASNYSGRTGLKKYIVLFVRLLLGLTGFFLIFFATGKIIPEDSANYKLFGFVQAALCGFWVSAASPWIFVKLRLTGVEQKQNA